MNSKFQRFFAGKINKSEFIIRRAHHRGACAIYQMEIDLGNITVEQAMTMLNLVGKNKLLGEETNVTTIEDPDALIAEIDRLEGTTTAAGGFHLFKDKSYFDPENGDEVLGIIHSPERLGKAATKDFSFLSAQDRKNGNDELYHGDSIIVIKKGDGSIKYIGQSGYSTQKGTGAGAYGDGSIGDEINAKIIQPLVNDMICTALLKAEQMAIEQELGHPVTVSAVRGEDGGIQLEVEFNEEDVAQMQANMVKGGN
jgi:hypothetical protein